MEKNPSVLPLHQRQANGSGTLHERLTPQSLDLEQSTLGAMLMDRDAVARVVEILTEGDFYRELHKKIFKVIVKLFDKGEPIDFVTVAEELRRAGQLEEVGGSEYLTAIIDLCPSISNAGAYAKFVQEKSILRQLIKASDQISDMAYNQGDKRVDEIVSESRVLLEDIKDPAPETRPQHIKPLLLGAYDQIESQFQSKGEATGISTGFYDLDDITGGLQRSDLIVIASTPSMGKTSLCLNIASSVASNNKQPVVVFSLEMTVDKLTQRFISSDSSIRSQDLRKGRLLDSDWHRTSDSVCKLFRQPLFLVDKPNLTPREIRLHLLKLITEHGSLGLVAIDYLQLVQPNTKRENRTQDIGEIVRELKVIAYDFKVPIILTSQLSRAVEQREDKRPIFSDLRDSGTVAEDADVVCFLYRPSYYKRRRISIDESVDQDIDSDEGIAELIVGKQRNGPIGTIRLGFQPEYTRFVNLPRSEYDY